MPDSQHDKYLMTHPNINSYGELFSYSGEERQKILNIIGHPLSAELKRSLFNQFETDLRESGIYDPIYCSSEEEYENLIVDHVSRYTAEDIIFWDIENEAKQVLYRYLRQKKKSVAQIEKIKKDYKKSLGKLIKSSQELLDIGFTPPTIDISDQLEAALDEPLKTTEEFDWHYSDISDFQASHNPHKLRFIFSTLTFYKNLTGKNVGIARDCPASRFVRATWNPISKYAGETLKVFQSGFINPGDSAKVYLKKYRDNENLVKYQPKDGWDHDLVPDDEDPDL